MGTIIDLGAAMISGAGQRLEISAENMANVATPGYRSIVADREAPVPFPAFLAGQGDAAEQAVGPHVASRMAPGQIRQTANAFDLAIEGEGFFAVRGGAGLVYTRAGQFHRDADGRLVNGAGQALQGSGGDVVLHGDGIKVLADGTVLDAGEPVARIDVVRFRDPAQVSRSGTGFVTDSGNVEEAAGFRLGQGELETSNVSMAQEMLSMMRLQRSAETGRHLVQVYDDLLGRALDTFGQG